MKARWQAAAIAFTLTIADVARAFAEEGHAEGRHDEHGIPWATLLFSAINFCLFALLIARKVWPGVKQAVADRRDQIVKTMQEAAEAKAEAEKAKAEWQRRLANLQSEIDALRVAAKQDAERERDRILSAAQTTAESIRRDAERAATAEVRRVQQQLRGDLVREAIQIAETTVKSGWNNGDQQRSVTEFLKQVES